MRFSACIAAVSAASVLAIADSASAGDAIRGQDLYSERCQACHTESVHARVKRSARDFSAIREWVRHWSSMLKSGWGPDEIEDVATYLNATYYHFEPPATTTSLPAPPLTHLSSLRQVFPPTRW